MPRFIAAILSISAACLLPSPAAGQFVEDRVSDIGERDVYDNGLIDDPVYDPVYERGLYADDPFLDDFGFEDDERGGIGGAYDTYDNSYYHYDYFDGGYYDDGFADDDWYYDYYNYQGGFPLL